MFGCITSHAADRCDISCQLPTSSLRVLNGWAGMLHGPTSHSVHSFVAPSYWDLQTLGPCMHAFMQVHLLPPAKMQFKVSIPPNVSGTSRDDTLSCKTTTYYPRFKALSKLERVNLICTLYALCMAWFVEYFMILQIYEASLDFSDIRTWQCWVTVL